MSDPDAATAPRWPRPLRVQSAADFVNSRHARVGWPRERMGAALAFGEELTALLIPHAAS